MKHFRTKIPGLLLWISITCLLSCQSAERVPIPGTHCTIELPEGYALTAENIVKGPDSSISLSETTGNGLSADQLEDRNASQLIEALTDSRTTFTYGGKTFTRYAIQESEHEYAVLILQKSGHTIFINGLYPGDNEKERKIVLDAMLSVQYEESN